MKVQYVFSKDQPVPTKDETRIISDHPGHTKDQTGSTKGRFAKIRHFHHLVHFNYKNSPDTTAASP